MNEWHDLFVATAGSAAALTGLIFVGVSINLARILSMAKLPERALLALIFLLTILILSVVMLIPDQSSTSLGIEVLITGFITWVITVRMDISIYAKTELQFKRFYLFNLAINQAATIPYIIAAFFLITGNLNGVYWIVAAFILCFIKSIMDSWVLLVEINR
jgi:modulator of FtsH protease